MDCRTRLQAYLRENGVPFVEMSHPLAYTAQEVAALQHVPGMHLAKVVMVLADSRLTMLVLPSTFRIDFEQLKAALGAKEVRLAKENEFEGVFPDCETGAMPPFGNLYNVPVVVERELTKVDKIVFQAGTHRETMQIAYPDYARLVNPMVAGFARPIEPVRLAR